MALLVCCPCGNPLDCDHLEVVVTLTCPRCERELELELEDARHGRFFAILTVMEGPCWLGERFVMPVGQALILGSGPGGWLSLESEKVAEKHCRLELARDGRVHITDLASEAGTWIGPLRIAKGRLKAKESFRVGEYRFRLDYLASLGGELVSDTDEDAVADASGLLPVMAEVGRAATIGDRLVRSRYGVCRWLLLIFAWSSAAFHACALATQPGADRWPWHWALLAGAAIVATLIASAHRVTLAHRSLKYVSLVALGGLALVDFLWPRPFPAICALLLASGVALLTVRMPARATALPAAALGAVATLIMAIAGVHTVAQSAVH